MSERKEKRNELRHISVKYIDYVWLFNWGDSTLSFNDKDYSKCAVKIYDNNGRLMTRYGETPMVVYLFHEMLHWFHNIQRYDRYKNPDMLKHLGLYFSNFEEFTLSPQIWNGQPFGEISWRQNEIDGEEVATILGKGLKIENDDHYENGDELSENLFSCSLTEQSKGSTRATMRWGHALLPIIADPKNAGSDEKSLLQCDTDNEKNNRSGMFNIGK